ncbi:MAG: potassium/proton antiporter [Actinobacteria bacterium]|uniref:Unannotated protein n=1 Tax=freshwater metagenome TaxID=449393 RepID=A0A6J7SAT0_9ZZZZ|nr:potassium/proton antiporter [Actinomycetota bacterium]MTB27644.1 potassium/proton antiporter [Actinomycetota bacterium]
MTLDSLAPALLVGAVIVLVAILGVRFAGRLGVPGLLLYLGIGLVLGTVFEQLNFQDAELAAVLGYIALVLILVQGGLTTRISELRPVLWPAVALASVGVLASIGLVAVPLIFFAGMSTSNAMLLAAVLAATDAAAVFSVLRKLKLSPRLRTVLEGEAGFNDAPVVVLVSLIASGAFTDSPWWLIAFQIFAELVGGAIVGVLGGMAARWILPRLALPAVGLYPIAAMAMLVGTFALADFIHVSGFMAVYVGAVILGSAIRLPHRRSIIGFADGLAWISEIGLFVMLGLLVNISRLPQALGIAAVAGVTLVFFARPIAAFVSLTPFRWGLRERLFVSVAGLRGAVPIVFAAIPLGLAVTGAEQVFDATVIVVIVLLLVQTPFLPMLAKRLGVILPAEVAEFDLESAPLDAMDAVVLALDVPEGSGLIGVFISELGLPKGVVVSLIVRDNESFPIDSNSRLRALDRVLVVCPGDARNATEARLRLVAKDGKLATWIHPPEPVKRNHEKPSWPRVVANKAKLIFSRDQ